MIIVPDRQVWTQQPQYPRPAAVLAKTLGFTHIFCWGGSGALPINSVSGSLNSLTNPTGEIYNLSPGPGGIGLTTSAAITTNRLEVVGNPFATSVCTYLVVEALLGNGGSNQGQCITESNLTSNTDSGSLQIRKSGNDISVLRSQQAATLTATGGRVDGKLNCWAISIAGDNGRHAFFTQGALFTSATPTTTYTHGTSAIANGQYSPGSQDIRMYGPLYLLAFAPVAIPDTQLAPLTNNPWQLLAP